MEKRIINPWGYQDISDFIPAVEIKNQLEIPSGSQQVEAQLSFGGTPGHLTKAPKNLKEITAESAYRCQEISGW